MAGEEGGHTDTRDTEVSDACTVVVVRILDLEMFANYRPSYYGMLCFSHFCLVTYMHGAIRCFFMGWYVCVGRVKQKQARCQAYRSTDKYVQTNLGKMNFEYH